MAVNATRLQGIDGTNATDLTRAEVETRIQAWEIHKFLQKYVGGFEKSYILDTGAQVGVRETRHIRGDYQLTEEDVLANRAFDDGIACGTFAIDIRPEEHTSELQSLMRTSYAVFCLKKKNQTPNKIYSYHLTTH